MASKKVYRKTIRVNGKPITLRFSKKSDAEEWYQNMLRAKRNAKAGLEADFEPLEFERVAADFLMSRQELETWKHDKFRIQHYFFPRFRGRMLHTIGRKEWKEAFDDLIRVYGLKPKTHNNIRTTILGLYKHALSDEPRRAQFNPILEIKPLPVIQEEIQFFRSQEECRKYLTHAQAIGPMFGMFAYIALNTGMREGEITSLSNDSVNLDRRTIHVRRTWSYSQRKIVSRTKGKRERVLGISDTLHDAFIRHQKVSPFRKPSDLVVCNKSGAPLESKHLQEMHSRAIKSANLDYIVIHGLRHTFATQFLSNGGQIWDLKNILGHRSIKTTERYAHVLPVAVQSRANIFEVSGK